MLPELAAAFALTSVCVLIHASGLAFGLARITQRSAATMTTRHVVMTLVFVASWLMALHLAEVAVWATFLVWQRCLPDFETALYFSGTSYATVGYGDVLLPQDWRLLGPIEGLIGILMCGLSTGFFFAVIVKLAERIPRAAVGSR